MHDVDGVNAGYARLLLDEYLDNPEAVPPEWRALFENGDTAVVRDLPAGCGCSSEHRPRERRSSAGHGDGAAGRRRCGRLRPGSHGAGEPRRSEPPAGPTPELLGGVAAAMALVKAHRMHGHLAARLDPLGAEPSATRRSTRSASSRS